MMGILYKLFTKALATRINPILQKVIYSSHSSFVKGQSIYDNRIAVQLGIEYTISCNKHMVLMQLAWDLQMISCYF